MFVYLTPEGQEAVALGQDVQTWHVRLSQRPVNYEGFEDMLIGEIDVKFPSKEACAAPVIMRLAELEKEIHAEAHKRLSEVKIRRESLLCLEAPK